MSTVNRTSNSSNWSTISQGLDNLDLFYNNQVRTEGKSWELSIGSGSDNFKIRGMLDNADLNFGISNNFGGNLEDSFIAQAVDKIKSFMKVVQKNIPTLNVSRGLGKALAEDVNLLMGNKNQTFFQDAVGDVSKFAEDLAHDALEGITSLTDFIPNTSEKLGIANLNEKAARHGITDQARLMAQIVSPFDDTKTYAGSSATVPTVMLQGYVFHKKGTRNVIDFLIECIKRISGTTFTEQGGMFGLQTPPNNYIPKLDMLLKMSTEAVPGTWNLRMGKLRYYNVLINNFNFEISKYRAIEGWDIPAEQGTPKPIIADDPFMASFTISFNFANKVLPEDIINLLQNYK